MRRSRHRAFVLATVCSLLASTTPGCRLRDKSAFKPSCGDDCYAALATQIEYPAVTPCTAVADDGWAAIEPLTLASTGELEYWDLSLQETVQIALAQSRVIRDLGGAVI